MAGLFECFRTFKNSFPNSPENQQALVIVYSPEQPKFSFMLGQLFQAQSPSLCQQQLLFVENYQVTLIKACLTSPFSCLKPSVLLAFFKENCVPKAFPTWGLSTNAHPVASLWRSSLSEASCPQDATTLSSSPAGPPTSNVVTVLYSSPVCFRIFFQILKITY